MGFQHYSSMKWKLLDFKIYDNIIGIFISSGLVVYIWFSCDWNSDTLALRIFVFLLQLLFIVIFT